MLLEHAEQASLVAILPQCMLYKTSDVADARQVTMYWADICGYALVCTRSGCNTAVLAYRVAGLGCLRRDVVCLINHFWTEDEVINVIIVLLKATHRFLEECNWFAERLVSSRGKFFFFFFLGGRAIN